MTRSAIGWILGLAGLIVAASLIKTGYSGLICGTPQPDSDVEALPDDRAEMQIALPDSTLPCGLGRVEWGHQIFELEEYPSCRQAIPAVTVYCLNDQAEWTADAITITEISTDAITLDAQREGICGIFPKQ